VTSLLRKVAVFAASMVLLVPQPGTAGPKGGPVIDSSDQFAYCDTGLGITAACISSANADVATKALSVKLSISSPGGGLLPGYGLTYGYATLLGHFTTKKSAKALLLSATFHIDSSGASEAATVGGDSSFAYGYVSVGADDLGASAGWASQTVIDSNGSTTPGDVTVQAVVANCSSPGAEVAAGQFFMGLGVDGVTHLGSPAAPGVGTASLGLDVTATSVSVEAMRTLPPDTCGPIVVFD
jgi:hypothetical protein